MRRDDLGKAIRVFFSGNVNTFAAIPYINPVKDKNEGDISGTMATTLPMAAVHRLVCFVAFAHAHYL